MLTQDLSKGPGALTELPSGLCLVERKQHRRMFETFEGKNNELAIIQTMLANERKMYFRKLLIALTISYLHYF